MAAIPTIRVVFKKFGQPCWINAVDFDPEVHELYVDPAVRAAVEAEAKKKAKAAAEAATVDVTPEPVLEPEPDPKPEPEPEPNPEPELKPVPKPVQPIKRGPGRPPVKKVQPEVK
jgi:periplasmic protein TonB